MLVQNCQADPGGAQSITGIEKPDLLTHVDDTGISLAVGIKPAGCKRHNRLVGEAGPVNAISAAGVFQAIAARRSRRKNGFLRH